MISPDFNHVSPEGRDLLAGVLDLTIGPPALKVWVGSSIQGIHYWPDAVMVTSDRGTQLSNFQDQPGTTVIGLFPEQGQRVGRVLDEILRALPNGTRIAVWGPVLAGPAHADIRKVLLSHGYPEWIIWLHSSNGLLKSNLVVFSNGIHRLPKNEPLRFVDLDSAEFGRELELVRKVAKRGGGEGPGFFLRREPNLDSVSWTFPRSRKDHDRALRDLEELGSITCLGEFFEVHSGIKIIQSDPLKPSPRLHSNLVITQTREMPENCDEIPNGYLGIYYGQSVMPNSGLAVPTRIAPVEAFNQKQILLENDLLVPQISRSGRPLKVAKLLSENLPGVAHHSLLVVRPKLGIPESLGLAKFLPFYLRSQRVAALLDANASFLGDSRRVSASDLATLPLPLPKPEVFQALDRLEADEACHQRWAEELAATRMDLFMAPSYREAVPELLRTANLSADRIHAAQDAGTLDYMVRERFPHPIALRRQDILRTPHGEARLKKIRECAEFLVSLLAAVAMTDRSLPLGHGHHS